MERWGIELEKEYFKFSAAHFLIFPDGTAERLHGHNYRVFVEVGAGLSEHGLVIDFKMIKPVVRELVDSLDEHWIVPGEHPVLSVERREDGVTEVRYMDRYYRRTWRPGSDASWRQCCRCAFPESFRIRCESRWRRPPASAASTRSSASS